MGHREERVRRERWTKCVRKSSGTMESPSPSTGAHGRGHREERERRKKEEHERKF